MFNRNVMNEKESLIRKYTSLVKKYNDGISLAIGEPDLTVDEKIINRTIKSLEDKEYKYTNAQGDEELLLKICEVEDCKINNVIVTSGSSEGIFVSLLSLLNKDDEVIVVTPCYPQYAPIIKFCNANVVYLDTTNTNFIPVKDNLVKLINKKTKAIIINSPQNPTGLSYDDDTLEMIEKIAVEYNIFLLLDDVYKHICFTRKSKHKFTYQNVIILKSFSKTYGMTGFRLGYIIACEEVIEQVLKVHSYISISVPVFTQKAGVEALNIGEVKYEKIIQNLNIVTSFFDGHDIKYIDINGGIFIFIDTTSLGISGIEFCDKLLEEYHVACVPGECFMTKNFVRINYAIEQEKLIEAIERINKFIKNKKGT